MFTQPIIGFKKLHELAQLPVYTTAGAAGADVRAVEDAVLMNGERLLVRTGLGCDIPAGWELQVRPRSGLAFKNGITVLNAPGTIDSDYTGELCVLLMNHSDRMFMINAGDRIAQIVVAPVTQGDFTWSAEASRTTGRDAAGFGSSGVK